MTSDALLSVLAFAPWLLYSAAALVPALALRGDRGVTRVRRLLVAGVGSCALCDIGGGLARALLIAPTSDTTATLGTIIVAETLCLAVGLLLCAAALLSVSSLRLER